MSTAIARIYTREGFVIAADGRESDQSGNVRSDRVQKIFSVEHPCRRLAYTIAGKIQLTQLFSPGEVLFDFVGETSKALEDLAHSKCRSLIDFSRALADKLMFPLSDAKTARLSATPPGFANSESNTHIFIDGYYNHLPKRTHIIFHHFGAAQTETDKKATIGSLRSNHGYGSQRVLQRLDEEDDFFADYKPCKISEELTLADAIVIARNRVRAHFDPLAIKLDPSCRAMGGHIHIAKVTREDGLRWAPGFEPLN
jgi:hypothetical protein